MALCLMVLWVPLTSHCYLEDSGLFQSAWEKCCSDEDSQSAKADPCDAGCKLVEKGAGKIQDNQRLIVPIISLLAAIHVVPAPATISLHNEVTFWPPETLHLTQFVASTALPVRAPSLLS